MPELSDCSASLTKEDIKNLEVELNVKIPAGMKNFYLKFNGGMPVSYTHLLYVLHTLFRRVAHQRTAGTETRRHQRIPLPDTGAAG